MSLQEFQLWQQFDGESPLPDIRADFHSAQVTNAIVNMAGMSVKEQVPFRNHILFRPQDKPIPRKTDPSEFFKGKK